MLFRSFAGETLMDYIDDIVLCEQETACVRVWVWMDNVEKLPTRGTLKLEEPIEVESPLLHYPEVGIHLEVPARSGPLRVIEHDVLIHLDKVVDHTNQSDSSSDSHESFHSDVSGMPLDPTYGDDGVVTWGYRWTLGFED